MSLASNVQVRRLKPRASRTASSPNSTMVLACVCVYEAERVRIFGVRYWLFENTHSREYIHTCFIHPLHPHIFLFSLPLQELSPRKDPGWRK
jgi:hypothetical protein